MVIDEEKLNGKLIIALSRALQRIHQKSEQLFRKNGITMAQFMALEALYHKGDLTIKEIIAAILSSSGNMTVVIRNLESRGLVRRLAVPEDKRACRIQITQKGKELLVPVYTQHMQYAAQALEALTAEEKNETISIMRKIQTEKRGNI